MDGLSFQLSCGIPEQRDETDVVDKEKYDIRLGRKRSRDN